ncbi:hypothetical protein A3B48_00280 [Candidatus Gottesmanbacteria bacterium RIFCSPLOWO2_01_FULL_40_10]|uniref:SAM-dependent methyltransferase n=1 Tax=Candidatus Gottesmanbacteria bacterium RIFCSPHIGHO2_01_FULL_40_15 TaxID=1798376 RepID=A0A1F5Z201_9BACT|nr:MAG: hypothetical protein A2777_05930 [Candidatus Gottesmanbacteria bacterium RIFCSPHIGHO2_01_FULL_40_15]OGG23203.1 MAG: hypothetical protein A3B48_00280 [Candidatus Gottesmanbacteria bacterium RIFCSPLOWO2_01_FULL_40_10]
MSSVKINPSSFRDKSGYVFRTQSGLIIRTVNKIYQEDYDHLIKSGLLNELFKNNLLVSHREEEVGKYFPGDSSIYKILAPRKIPFVTYPYEWSLSQLKEAALLTLKAARLALKYGMILKDASAYNVQFVGTKPVLIDTLSFEKRKKNNPWPAYRQFCQHFLAPLALVSFRDARLINLSGDFIDGIDLDMAVNLLPRRFMLNIHLFIHLYLHSKGQKLLGKKSPEKINPGPVDSNKIANLFESLEQAVNSCGKKKASGFWAQYYSDNNYSVTALEYKKKIIADAFKKTSKSVAVDIGANTGLFSRLVAKNSRYVISLDSDPDALDVNFNLAQQKGIGNILPLFADITNPSPAIGWRNLERQSLIERLPGSNVLALAITHHLYFSNHLSFLSQADFFNSFAESLLIEYIPDSDSQVNSLIGMRTLDLSTYSEKQFTGDFGKYFRIIKRFPVNQSKRVIYLMIRKNALKKRSV